MEKEIHPTVQALIEHFKFTPLPVEGTLFQQSYISTQRTSEGGPTGTAIIGMYCEHPKSVSCFHRLTHDEVWHFYGGDPLILYLLFPNGSYKEVIMGPNPLAGQVQQFVVPANCWQGGRVQPGSTYALFGCTMAPGFTTQSFEAALAKELISQYPEHETIIRYLAVNGGERTMES